MTEWQKLCKIEDIDPKEILALSIGGVELIVVMAMDGSPKVFQDLCSHQDVKLSDFGEITEDSELICHAHAARFCLADGKALCHPATTPIVSYPCKVESGQLWVQLPSP